VSCDFRSFGGTDENPGKVALPGFCAVLWHCRTMRVDLSTLTSVIGLRQGTHWITRTLYVLAIGVALLFVVLQTLTVTVLGAVTWALQLIPSPG
jgi:hypothetical protein